MTGIFFVRAKDRREVRRLGAMPIFSADCGDFFEK
jgi:hypothetical protein